MGRLLGVGAILGVGVSRGVDDGVGVTVAVAVGVGLGGVTVGVTVAVGVGVGVGPDGAQYLPPVFKKMGSPQFRGINHPPQMIISLPVHTAV